MKKEFIYFILFALLINNHVKAQSPNGIVSCPKDSILTWMKRFHVPAIGIGIIENGRIKSINVYGNIPPDGPAPKNPIWNIASMTKPVTALTVLKLVDEGKWNLDEPVSHYYVDPDIKDNPWANELTTRILLSHQSGFLNWKRMEPDGKLHFHFEPGKGWGYSGKGYEYLRLAMEAKFGHSIQQLAEQEVFGPLKMEDTHFGWYAGIDSSRFAWGYDTTGKRNTFKYKQNNAADWMVTSLSDYCNFGLSVIKGGGLSSHLYGEMTRIQAHFDTTAATRQKVMGLGWEVITGLPHNEFLLTHDGNDDGLATIGLLFPVSKRGIIIFTNGDEGDKVYSLILKASLPALKTELARYMGE